MKHSKDYNRKTIAYARVSSHDQKADLERQKQVLEMYCASNGWNFEVLSDLGSGINYNKKGLKELIGSIIDGEVGRLVITKENQRRYKLSSLHPELKRGIDYGRFKHESHANDVGTENR